MPTVCIVGASRGIGLGFAEAYAKDGWRVHATTRPPARPGALGRVAGDIVLHPLDVTDAGQIAALATVLAGEAIDVLIHNAGVMGDGMSRQQVMATNVDGAMDTTAALLDRVAASGQKKIAILTSQMGARRGGATPSGAYGASKAILNDRFRAAEPDWRARGLTAIVFHPGWVRTDMGGADASVTVKESVAGMRRVLDGLKPADSGKFLTWQGREHPW
ncbi:MAG: SDR family NAD(P)-dependent oxidoreductase [Alphaproteobacteria bacterium]|nr:SDR family NAD(P)-dependent oxidoreductase [Alphaproteobacteria bacterium]